MTQVSFDYDRWDDSKDLLLEEPGNTLGYAAINSSLELRRYGENTELDRTDLQDVVEGVVGLVAGGIEWLRWFGFTTEEVQARVNAVKRKLTESPYQQVIKGALRPIREIADAVNIERYLDKNKLIG